MLSPDDVCCALKNISRVVNPGGTIYIGGSGIIDNSHISPPEKVGLNLVFINIYDEGQAYTEQERRDWIAEVGFLLPLMGNLTILLLDSIVTTVTRIHVSLCID